MAERACSSAFSIEGVDDFEIVTERRLEFGECAADLRIGAFVGGPDFVATQIVEKFVLARHRVERRYLLLTSTDQNSHRSSIPPCPLYFWLSVPEECTSAWRVVGDWIQWVSIQLQNSSGRITPTVIDEEQIALYLDRHCIDGIDE